MNEFTINEFLKLHLENGKTIIYVDDKKVIQCKYLLLNPSSEKKDKLDANNQNNTVDDQLENLDRSLELNEDNCIEIPPEAEFWAHSSNLQAWYENDYDTHVLHTNLAFPLLRELTEAGDKLAKKVFKEEIKKRFRSGNLNVKVFLIKEGFLDRDIMDIDEYEELHEVLDFETQKMLQKRLREESNTIRDGFLI